MEGLEYRLLKLSVCLLCTVGISLGTGGEIGQPVLNATLTQVEVSCSTQLYFMLVMLCKETSLTRGANADA